MKFSFSVVEWAGCAAAIALARKRTQRHVDRTRAHAARHKVCGEFLSGEALEDLHALGIGRGLSWRGAHRLRSPLPQPDAPRRLRYLFAQPRSRARRSIQRSIAKAVHRRSPRRARSQCVSRSAARTANLWQGYARRPAPHTKLQTSFSPQASTICAATVARRTLTNGSPSRCNYRCVLPPRTADLGDGLRVDALFRRLRVVSQPGGRRHLRILLGGETVVNFARAGLRWQGLLAKDAAGLFPTPPPMAAWTVRSRCCGTKPIVITQIPYGLQSVAQRRDGLYCIGDSGRPSSPRSPVTAYPSR